MYYNGLVYVGMSGGEYGARGHVTAYNAPTASSSGGSSRVRCRRYRWGTWRGSEWQTCGATVWNYPAIDPQTNTLYFTTANADPWVGRGPGDNLFSASMVALDASTGEYRGHYQMVHHDIWDYDCPSPHDHVRQMIDGKLPPVVAEACKTGWVYSSTARTCSPAADRREDGAAERVSEHVGDAAVPGRRRVRDAMREPSRCSRPGRRTTTLQARVHLRADHDDKSSRRSHPARSGDQLAHRRPTARRRTSPTSAPGTCRTRSRRSRRPRWRPRRRQDFTGVQFGLGKAKGISVIHRQLHGAEHVHNRIAWNQRFEGLTAVPN